MANVVQNKAIVKETTESTLSVITELGKVSARDAVKALATARKQDSAVFLISYSK